VPTFDEGSGERARGEIEEPGGREMNLPGIIFCLFIITIGLFLILQSQNKI
jgi:hypothetical protein